MQQHGRQRPILPRTTSCYGQEEMYKAQLSSFHSNVPSKCNSEGDSLGKNFSTPLASFSRVDDSLRGEARKRRSPSPCCCEVQGGTQDEGYGTIRFHLPEAWELSRVQISEGKCEVCNKERRLRDLRRVSRRLFVGPEEWKDLWQDSYDADGWEKPRGDQHVRFRILPDEQEEDRRLPELDCEEEMPSEEALDPVHLGEYAGDTFVNKEDNEVDQQEPVSREAIRLEGPVHPWQDNAWEDELNDCIGKIFPYVSPPFG